MDDLSRKNLESPRNLERLESSNPPMTTIALSAGLKDSKLETEIPAMAADLPEEQPVENLREEAALERGHDRRGDIGLAGVCHRGDIRMAGAVSTATSPWPVWSVWSTRGLSRWL